MTHDECEPGTRAYTRGLYGKPMRLVTIVRRGRGRQVLVRCEHDGRTRSVACNRLMRADRVEL